MNEQDREYIEDIAKQMGQMPETFDASVVMRLWGIVDDLDKQLTEIVEAGEPILNGLKFYKTCPDSIQLSVVETKFTEIAEFTVGDLRRLAQKLKEVNHV